MLALLIYLCVLLIVTAYAKWSYACVHASNTTSFQLHHCCAVSPQNMACLYVRSVRTQQYYGSISCEMSVDLYYNGTFMYEQHVHL